MATNHTISPQLEATREFWDASPCDGQESVAVRERFRYGKEPWLPPLLRRIATAHGNIVEVGCGQGTDGISLCRNMAPGGRYLGLDYSAASIASAHASAQSVLNTLNVTPEFREGNAESLDLADDSVECVYSCGVLHHTPDTQRAVDEVFRMLKPGATAYVLLYRTYSPRLLAAHLIRAFQKSVDLVTRQDRSLYRRLSGNALEARLGTAIQECLGVPVLRSYTAGGMRDLFRQYEVVSLSSVGDAIPTTSATVPTTESQSQHSAPFGVYYLMIARKPLH